jgi:hypothetical protein
MKKRFGFLIFIFIIFALIISLSFLDKTPITGKAIQDFFSWEWFGKSPSTSPDGEVSTGEKIVDSGEGSGSGGTIQSVAPSAVLIADTHFGFNTTHTYTDPFQGRVWNMWINTKTILDSLQTFTTLSPNQPVYHAGDIARKFGECDSYNVAKNLFDLYKFYGIYNFTDRFAIGNHDDLGYFCGGGTGCSAGQCGFRKCFLNQNSCSSFGDTYNYRAPDISGIPTFIIDTTRGSESGNGQFYITQQNWLRQQITNLPSSQKTVIIIGHHNLFCGQIQAGEPPADNECISDDPSNMVAARQMFSDLLSQGRQILYVKGHLHAPQFYTTNLNGKPFYTVGVPSTAYQGIGNYSKLGLGLLYVNNQNSIDVQIVEWNGPVANSPANGPRYQISWSSTGGHSGTGGLNEITSYLESNLGPGASNFVVPIASDLHLRLLCILDSGYNYESNIVNIFTRWSSPISPFALVLGDYGGGCGAGRACSSGCLNGAGETPGNPADQVQRFNQLIQQRGSTFPSYLVPVAGGHDKDDGSPAVGMKNWSDILLGPGATPSVTGIGNNTAWYYSFNYGQARFYFLDMNTPGQASETLSQQQVDWLRNDLNANMNKLAVISMHEPLATIDPSNSSNLKTTVRNWQAVATMLKDNPHPNILVLQGHIHKEDIFRWGSSPGKERVFVETGAIQFASTTGNRLALSVQGNSYQLMKIEDSGSLTPINLQTIPDFGNWGLSPSSNPNFARIGKGCTTAWYIDKDCDGWGVRVRSDNQYIIYGGNDYGDKPDANDNDPTVNTPSSVHNDPRYLVSGNTVETLKNFLQNGRGYNRPNRIFFIATNGVNSNQGANNINQPFATLSYIRDTYNLGPNDFVLYRGGTYGTASIDNLNGALGSPVVIMSYPGERVIFDGTSSIGFHAVNYVVTDGFIATDSVSTGRDRGIFLGDRNTHTVLRNVEVSRHIWGIFSAIDFTIEDVTIEDSVIHDNAGEHGIYLNSGGTASRSAPPSKDVKIVNNLIYRNRRQGIQFNGKHDSPLIDGNFIHSNAIGGIQAIGVQDGVFSNNLIFNNNHRGIHFFAYCDDKYNDCNDPEPGGCLVGNPAYPLCTSLSQCSGSPTNNPCVGNGRDARRSVDRNLIINNLIWVGTTWNGICPDSYSSGPPPQPTCSSYASPHDFAAISMEDWTYSKPNLEHHVFTDNQIRNNIFVTQNSPVFLSMEFEHVPGTTFNNNIIRREGQTFPYDALISRGTDGTHSVSGHTVGLCSGCYAWKLADFQHMTGKVNNLAWLPSMVSLFTLVSPSFALTPEMYNFNYPINSIAVNFGDPRDIPGFNRVPLLDIRRNPRNVPVDAGVYELQGPAVCGNNIVESGEQCDGTSRFRCGPNTCLNTCLCDGPILDSFTPTTMNYINTGPVAFTLNGDNFQTSPLPTILFRKGTTDVPLTPVSATTTQITASIQPSFIQALGTGTYSIRVRNSNGKESGSPSTQLTINQNPLITSFSPGQNSQVSNTINPLRLSLDFSDNDPLLDVDIFLQRPWESSLNTIKSIRGRASGTEAYTEVPQRVLTLATPPNGPTFYHKFDEGTGQSIKDYSFRTTPCSSTGCYPIASPSTTCPSCTFTSNGIINGAYSFTGQGFFDIGGSGPKLSSQTTFAFEAFVKASAVQSSLVNNRAFIAGYIGSVNGYRLELRRDSATSQLYLGGRIGQGTGQDLALETQINAGQWYHVILLADGSSLKLYLNGNQVASTPWTGQLQSCSSNCPSINSYTLGGYGGQGGLGGVSAGNFSGEIDEVVLYYRALTSGEIFAHSLLTGTHPLGTYVWEGRVSDRIGVTSTGPVTFTIIGGTQTIPNAPTNLRAVTKSSTQINLTWQDNSNNENSFEVERRTLPSGTFSPIATNILPNTQSYSDLSLVASTSYEYRVRAVNSAGSSAYSNTASNTTFSCTPNAQENCPNQIGVCLGTVRTCGSNGQWGTCDYSSRPGYSSVESGSVLCSDNLDNNCNGEYDYDGSDNGLIRGDSGCPVQITSIKTSSQVFVNTQFSLNCTSNPGDISSVNGSLDGQTCGFDYWSGNIALFRCMSSSTPKTQIARCDVKPGYSYQTGPALTSNVVVVSSPCSSFTSNSACEANSACDWCLGCSGSKSSGGSDRCVSAGTCGAGTYQCVINQCGATCDGTSGGCSQSATCDFNACGCVEQRPVITQLTPSSVGVSTSTLIVIDGNFFAQNAEVRVDGVALPTTRVSATRVTWNYVANSLSIGRHLIAVLNPTSSIQSTTTAFDVLQTIPNAPTNLQASAISQTRIDLTWLHDGQNLQSFELQRRTLSSGTFGTIASNLPANTRSYSDNSVVASTSYEYRVRAVNSVGQSAWSDLANATTPSIGTFTFSLNATPSTQTVIQGQNSSTIVTVERLGGTGQAVTLSHNLSLLNTSFTPTSCIPNPSCNITFNVTTNSTTLPENYNYTINGSYSGMSISSPVTQFSLSVISCGNNLCDYGETCNTCSGDCGSCSSSSSSGGGSSSSGSGRGGPPRVTPPQCDDGVDNDLDGFIDYPADPGCLNEWDTSELSSSELVSSNYTSGENEDNQTGRSRRSDFTVSVVLWFVIVVLVGAIAFVAVIIIRLLREHKNFSKLSEVLNN